MEKALMTLHVNGDPRTIEAGSTVERLLEALAVRAPAIAVEVNRAIVPRSAYRSHELREGDRIEIVTFVGGG